MRNNKLIQGGAEYKSPTCVIISLTADSFILTGSTWRDSDNFTINETYDVFGKEL